MGAADATLTSGCARARIATRGAEWRAWAIAGMDLLWPGDPAVWSNIAPVLFPVVGWTREGQVRVSGATYELGLHGFAGGMEFEIAEQRQDRVTLVLRDEPQTRALYPFSFRLEIVYRLTPTAMEIALLVTNTGGGRMPYAVGLHPGFRWPMAGSAARHAIIFERHERQEVPVIAAGGLFSARRRPVPMKESMLPLDAELFASEALCFLNIASRKILYDNGAGQGLLLCLDNFPHVALWARPAAPFLAIEAWTGHGDPEGFDGDLFEKPSMTILEPGASGRHAVRYEFLPDASCLNSVLQEFAHLPKER